MATGVLQNATGLDIIDGLLTGFKWAGDITFSFPQLANDYPWPYADNEQASLFTPVTYAQREAVRAILTGETYGGTTSVMLATSAQSFLQSFFSEAGGLGNGLNGTGDIRVAEADIARSGLPAYTYYPEDFADGHGGDVWFGKQFIGTDADYRNPVLGGFAYQSTLHELGHALGLKHSQDLGGVSNVAVPAALDCVEFTVMSYRSYEGQDYVTDGGYVYGQFDAPQTFMQLDILALQTMYGAYYGANAGKTTYSWSSTTGETFINGVSQGMPGANRVFMTVWDGGGNDTYDMSNYKTGVQIDLGPGHWCVTSQVQRANLGDGHKAHGTVHNAFLFHEDLRSIIENAKGGSGSDVLVGNQVANRLEGGRGNDSLHGWGGRDTLIGGAGADTFRLATTDESRPGIGNRDQILDFQSHQDKIDLHLIDANAASAHNNPFNWLGHGAFHSHHPGELHWLLASTDLNHDGHRNDVIVEGSTDNDAGAEFQIELLGALSVTKSDFYL